MRVLLEFDGLSHDKRYIKLQLDALPVSNCNFNFCDIYSGELSDVEKSELDDEYFEIKNMILKKDNEGFYYYYFLVPIVN